MMMNIVVDSHIPHLQGVLEPWAGQVRYLPGRDITAPVVRDADILLVRTRTRCDASLLDGSRVRFIGTATIGTDHIDLDYCRQHGITVANAPGCNAPAVAQWVFAAIGTWMRHRGIGDCHGLTLGVVGVGHIGSIVARWGKQLGFKVLLNDPPLQQAGDKRELLPLEVLQQRCDIITFHTPLTRQQPHATWHLCDQSWLAGLQQCQLVINAARGGIVDNVALAQWHGDTAIDCWENEPHILPALLDKCVVATPHIAGYSSQGKQRATAMMLTALNAHCGWDIPVSVIEAPATGALNVTMQDIMDSYDIAADTARLRSDTTQFETLRNHYALRSECL